MHVPTFSSCTNVSSNTVSHVDNCVFMPVVSVRVNGSVYANALLDTASTNSFCTKKLVEKLGVSGQSISYDLHTLSQSEVRHETECVDIDLAAANGIDVLPMSNVYVVDKIPAQVPAAYVTGHSNLNNIPIVQGKVEVDILIGQDNSEALIPLEIRRGVKGEPFATRTLLGWSLNGPAGEVTNKEVISHFIATLPNKPVDADKLMNFENDDVCSDKLGLSADDEKVIRLWDEQCEIVNGQYQIPIPWKEGKDPTNNLEAVIPRLTALKRSLSKRGIYAVYDNEIDKLLSQGYAEAVPPEEILSNNKVWYLPHHPVITEKKPGKVRVVFDCSAKYRGESLNDKVYQGPDFNNKLVHVLLRFREEPFAVMADIEAMYNRVKVPIFDRNALRFIWYDKGGSVQHLRMTSHIFGGIWCSSAATYALHKVTKDQQLSAEVNDTILSGFYVDDCLKSFGSKEKATTVISELTTALGNAGFRLTKFKSNEDEMLSGLSTNDIATEMRNVQSKGNVQSKALGIKWDTLTDSLHFEVKNNEDSCVTRRKMLSYVSSLYDPLGLVGPIILKAKLMLQTATRLGLQWDESVPAKLSDEWTSWCAALRDLTKAEVPRCVKPPHYDDAVLELHHFSDASESGFGFLSYLRCINKVGEIHTALLYSKSRVAPLKTLTIPRLKLQAAALATMADITLRNELSLYLNPSTFWIDSEIVMGYISNEKTRFNVFVSNRLSIIRRNTTVEQWRHVPGQENPADVASRGCMPTDLQNEEWFTGPRFLRTHKSEWKNNERQYVVRHDDVEVKTCETFLNVKSENKHDVDYRCSPIVRLMNHYSSWYRMKKAVAWILKVRERLRKYHRGPSTELSVADLDNAETVIIKYIQGRLKGEVEKNRVRDDAMRKLNPYVDAEGIIRVGGRTTRADVNNPNQIIITDEKAARMIAHDMHDKCHMGLEYTLAQIRGRSWVRRKHVREVVRRCIICRKLNGRPCMQLMGELPATRLSANEVPFHHTGIDCFGPFIIKRARSELKRYGCVFTCMSTRAIHLEMLESLDTDSFLNALRRFIARRGQPETITSDNGGNFVKRQQGISSRSKRTQPNKDERNNDEKRNFMEIHTTYSSHFGGSWERQIRSVRKVLLGLLGEQKLTEETLSTLLCEVENILNNRPITPTSDDANDFQALRPSHLLMMQASPSSPCKSDSKDIYRSRWRQVQYLADLFWKRWLKEYLPELQRRQKWLTEKPNVSVGDLVLLVDENVPRNLWPMGRVVEVCQSDDKLVRNVKVKTKCTCLTRPITKLVMLEGCLYQ